MEPPRILVVGGGFAGVECVRRLERLLTPDEASITLVAARNYQLYLPLLPQVAAGMLTPQSVAVSLRRLLRRTRVAPGAALGVDLDAKVCVVRGLSGRIRVEPYEYLVLAPGSVTRTFDIPGLAEHARGMKTLAEAAYLRDHVIAQLDIAAAAPERDEQEARLQFVVVGGGYSGTETAAALHRLTSAAAGRYPGLDPHAIKWHLVDIAPKLMPELGDDLGEKATDLLRQRGIDVSLGVSVAEADAETVRLTDGRVLPCHTLIWTAGVRPSPLIDTLGAETVRGRLKVTENMDVPERPGVFAVGDAAAVPDISKGDGAVCPPTAQHAQRQGRAVARNVAATLRGQPMEPYQHRDMGLVVDLGGTDAVANPLGVPLTGLPAQAVTRGYHMVALHTSVARARVLTNWVLNATSGDDYVRMGFLANQPATLRELEHTDAYLSADQLRSYTRPSDVPG
ncbi:NAD(P)/FAD-dependent oxidoreductase [Saccharomonospora cyanea]|uniref:NADH dehydrogenase, FAD-containing subunit n=1 Tax=Saccharomonospora cyanea NA-134 TaxID=882082 RepID=H5XNJ0_9PSEU|nr:NAD(P)/FAD-dependent oxidoreductase [Saccharomonospora cyanea]EHR61051.1 NADH dehydrogenase, FAD-containing subunit [Saccharomonospora cyanea NA-134]